MSWIHQFARTKPKSPDYAEKTLKGYRLGIKAGGTIQGIRVLVGEESCPACRANADRVFSPDDVPILPVANCAHPQGCRCAYTLAMKPVPAQGEKDS